MRRAVSSLATFSFAREHLRTPLTLVLLICLPALFVIASAAVLGEFAQALGGTVAGNSASALGAGWAAAFLAGVLGYFEVASSRGADRRLSLAGFGAGRVALARIGAAIGLALLASAVAYLALALRVGIEHPFHAAAAIVAFALTYIGIGALIGSLISDALAGSLAVALIFLLDTFSGPGMTSSGGISVLMPTRKAADLLTAAGAGQGSPSGDWIGVAVVAATSLVLAFGAFWLSARSRTR